MPRRAASPLAPAVPRRAASPRCAASPWHADAIPPRLAAGPTRSHLASPLRRRVCLAVPPTWIRRASAARVLASPRHHASTWIRRASAARGSPRRTATAPTRIRRRPASPLRPDADPSPSAAPPRPAAPPPRLRAHHHVVPGVCVVESERTQFCVPSLLAGKMPPPDASSVGAGIWDAKTLLVTCYAFGSPYASAVGIRRRPAVFTRAPTYPVSIFGRSRFFPRSHPAGGSACSSILINSSASAASHSFILRFDRSSPPPPPCCPAPTGFVTGHPCNLRRCRLAAQSTHRVRRWSYLQPPILHRPLGGRAMRVPPCSRNRKPGAPDKRATPAFRPIHRRRLSFPVSRKGWCGRLGLRASCSDDRLSALTDDLLLLILRRLDTRTALATATLSKRWTCLPRCLDALDFRVSDILQARYYQCISVYGKAAKYAYGFVVNLNVVHDNIKRYERRAMRAMASSINSFLDADDDQDRGSLGLRSVRTLQLEFFPGHCSSSINRLIAKAADSWGVEDLEVSVKNTFYQHFAHSFPHHGLCNNPHNSRLRRLKLAACYIPPLKGFHALTSLVLEDLPESTPTAAYEAIFTLCLQLQALHLKSCTLNQGVVAVHAPKSQIKQLIMEDCWFGVIKLYTLPMLESMAVLHSNVIYELSSFPYLTHLNITFHRGVGKTRCVRVGSHYDLNQYFGGNPGISDLIVRFTGYHRWFKPWSPTLLFPKLRRLLIADVPSSWDVSWPRLLIEAAPCLECLHIHITPWEEEPHDDISWEPSEFCHNQLKELVVIGFQGTERQIYFVNFVIKVSTSLQLVSLYKNGHVQDRGHWDWDMVTQQYQWVNEEKVKILNQIADSAPCAPTPVQVVLE